MFEEAILKQPCHLTTWSVQSMQYTLNVHCKRPLVAFIFIFSCSSAHQTYIQLQYGRGERKRNKQKERARTFTHVRTKLPEERLAHQPFFRLYVFFSVDLYRILFSTLFPTQSFTPPFNNLWYYKHFGVDFLADSQSIAQESKQQTFSYHLSNKSDFGHQGKWIIFWVR